MGCKHGVQDGQGEPLGGVDLSGLMMAPPMAGIGLKRGVQRVHGEPQGRVEAV